jgi:hypothetical protein
VLTRFEVSGFKNLRDVVVDFGPFTCIAGPNGAGKSNLFDAIQLLSALSRTSFSRAFGEIRAGGGQRGTVRSMLSPRVLAGEENLRLAAELIVPGTTEVSYRSIFKVTEVVRRNIRLHNTFLRYEIELSVDDSDGVAPRLGIVRESLAPLGIGSLPDPMRAVCADYVVSESWSNIFATCSDENPRRGGTVFVDILDQIDDEEMGLVDLVDSVEIDGTKAAVLSMTDLVVAPEVRAVRREMASWRFLSLEPSAMRAADDVDEVGPISATGAHVPAFLHRREQRTGSAVCDEVRRAAAALVDIRTLRVVPNGDFLELRAQLGEGPELPARSLSDGTLRFLTLAALGVSDDIGLIALEEPENGIHPAKIEAMLGLLRSLSQPEEPEKPEEKNYSDPWSRLESTDPTESIDPIGPKIGRLRQVLVNTHSPYLVEEVLRRAPDDVLCAVLWARQDPDGRRSSSASFHPLAGTWRVQRWKERGGPRAMAPVSRSRLVDYLRDPAAENTGDDA